MMQITGIYGIYLSFSKVFLRTRTIFKVKSVADEEHLVKPLVNVCNE